MTENAPEELPEQVPEEKPARPEKEPTTEVLEPIDVWSLKAGAEVQVEHSDGEVSTYIIGVSAQGERFILEKENRDEPESETIAITPEQITSGEFVIRGMDNPALRCKNCGAPILEDPESLRLVHAKSEIPECPGEETSAEALL